MRPQAILNFEMLYLAAIAVEAVRIAIDWPILQGSPYLLGLRISIAGITLALVLLSSRRRSKVARALLTATFLIGLPVVGTLVRADTYNPATFITMGQLALQLLALIVLFSRPGRQWFAQQT